MIGSGENPRAPAGTPSATIDVTGVWESDAWGAGPLVQEGAEVTGKLRYVEVSGTVQGDQVHLFLGDAKRPSHEAVLAYREPGLLRGECWVVGWPQEREAMTLKLMQGARLGSISGVPLEVQSDSLENCRWQADHLCPYGFWEVSRRTEAPSPTAKSIDSSRDGSPPPPAPIVHLVFTCNDRGEL